MSTMIPKELIKGRECKHVVHCRSQIKGDTDDLLVAKEYIHTTDGRRIPRLALVENRPFDFWVTLPAFRNHEQKKEAEDISRLQKFTTTYGNLNNSILRALNQGGGGGSLRRICRSPYVYGATVKPTVLLKDKYKKAFPKENANPYSVAALDIETNQTGGKKEINLISITFKDKVFLAYNKMYFKSPHYKRNVEKKIAHYLDKYIKERNIAVEVEGYDNAGACVAATIERAHEWGPDFISIWNINFDLPEMIQALKDYNYSLADVFSDPCIPHKYRFFEYHKDEAQKVTQEGNVTSKNFVDLWNTASCPAKFFFVDAMAVYKRLRQVDGLEPNYKLNRVLNDHLGLGKLRFEETNHIKENTDIWHIVMQRDYPEEYAVYNVFDCIALELLDEKTSDLSQVFPNQCDNSEFHDFSSNPTLIVDDLHFFFQEHGKIIATASDKMRDEYDDMVVGLRNWIVTLSSYMMADNGIALFKDMKHLRSMIHVHLADCDIVSTYPTEQGVMNISKKTTLMEMVEIQGLTEMDRRYFGIDLTGGSANALEHGRTVFQLPVYETWSADFSMYVIENNIGQDPKLVCQR